MTSPTTETTDTNTTDTIRRTTLAGEHVHGNSPLAVSPAGLSLDKADFAMVLVHGRGGSAEDILSLAREMSSERFAYVAPRAAGHTWYPYSFLAPTERNEPGLSSALRRLEEIVEALGEHGIAPEKIVLLGFSQGACLALEFAARHARKWGAVVAFTGGLIGPPGVPREYDGDFAGTPIFLGSSDRDAHVPLERVQESTRVLRGLGAEVEERIYPGMPHTIIEDEVAWVRERLAALEAA